MRYLEIGLFVLSIFSLSCFLINWPGAALVSTLQLAALSSFYFYLGFAVFNNIGFSKIFNKTSYKSISKLKIIGAICTGISLSILIIGILFKMKGWPGAKFTLMFGVFLSFIISVIALIKFINKKSYYYKFILSRTIFFITIGVFLVSIPQMTLINIKYKNHPKYIKLYENAMQNPDSEEAWQKVHEEEENIINGR